MPATGTGEDAPPEPQAASALRSRSGVRFRIIGAFLKLGEYGFTSLACAGCHDTGAPMAGQGRPLLSLASDLSDTDPTSAIQAVLRGIEPPVADRGPNMPPFSDNLTDEQVAATLAYARARFTNQPPWPHIDRMVEKARKESQP